MSERQKHGFDFEQYCSESYGVNLSHKYGSVFDGTYNGFPVSIKCEKYKTDIEMADYFRNSEIKEDFYMIIGFWKGNQNNICEVDFLKINGTDYHSMFNLNMNQDFKNLLSNITNDYSDDEYWKEEIKLLRNKWKNSTPNLIRPRFKRDHKKQKRVQCAINNKDFYNYFLKKYVTEDFNDNN